MARATLTKTSASGSYPTAGVTLTFTAANSTDKEQFKLTGNDLLIARNVGVGAVNVTISSVANSKGRTGNVTDSIAAGAYRCYGPFKQLKGWVQSDGYLYIEAAASTDIEWAVVKLD